MTSPASRLRTGTARNVGGAPFYMITLEREARLVWRGHLSRPLLSVLFEERLSVTPYATCWGSNAGQNRMRQQGAVEYFDDDSFGANSRHADSPGDCDYEFGERGLGGGRVRESLGGCARFWDSGLFRPDDAGAV